MTEFPSGQPVEGDADGESLAHARELARDVVEKIGVDGLNKLIARAREAVESGEQGVMVEDEGYDEGGLHLTVTPDELGISHDSHVYRLPMVEVQHIIDETPQV